MHTLYHQLRIIIQSLEEEEKQLKVQLCTLKDYNDQLQEKQQELAKQKDLYIKKEARDIYILIIVRLVHSGCEKATRKQTSQQQNDGTLL